MVYISIDVETDGPIPGRNSMLALGAAAFSEEGELLGTFTANLEALPEATPDPETMAWWETQPAAWSAHRKDLQSPTEGMKNFVAWVRSACTLENSVDAVCIAYPAGFDFTFVYWYLRIFVGTSPFSFSCLDIKSYASGVLGIPYRRISKKTLSAFIPKDNPHTHIASEDAVEQGMMFLNIRSSTK
jgi:hypothetical protein